MISLPTVWPLTHTIPVPRPTFKKYHGQIFSILEDLPQSKKTGLTLSCSFKIGLKSRFELINFEDFDEDELKTIWRDEISKRKFECDDQITAVMARRLAKSSGRKGFGNARAVRKEVTSKIHLGNFLWQLVN